MSTNRHTFIIAALIILITNVFAFADSRENAKAIDVSGGEDHTLVLTANKWPWACGHNGWYQLGTGNNEDQHTLGRVEDGNMVTISGYLEDINDVDSGWKHSLALEKYDPNDPNYKGYVWAWGRNDEGELGVGEGVTYSSTPVQVLRGEQVPSDANDPNLARIIDISAGRSGEHSLAVDANGYVYAWGLNAFEQCGNGISGGGQSGTFVKDFG